MRDAFYRRAFQFYLDAMERVVSMSSMIHEPPFCLLDVDDVGNPATLLTEEPIRSNVALCDATPLSPKMKAPAAHSHRGPHHRQRASTHRLTSFTLECRRSNPPTTINAAQQDIPESLAAVACFNQPTTHYGLRNPQRLPIELIIAINRQPHPCPRESP